MESVAKPCPEGRGEPELLWLLWEIKGVEAVEAGIDGIGSGCGSSYHGPTWKHRILHISDPSFDDKADACWPQILP